jgi:predicted nucleic acid-binding protein
MKYKRVFLDANIILDIFDEERVFYKSSSLAIEYLLSNNAELFTSYDIITTLYYVLSKKDKSFALEAIKNVNTLCKVVEFSNDEVEKSYLLMKKKNFLDLEDTIQYIMAKKAQCDLILSNDKKFISQDIELLSSKEFVAKTQKKWSEETKKLVGSWKNEEL